MLSGGWGTLCLVSGRPQEIVAIAGGAGGRRGEVRARTHTELEG
jgi:hypothetical protein